MPDRERDLPPLDAEEAQKAVDILASHGEQASVIGRVTDSEGVVIR